MQKARNPRKKVQSGDVGFCRVVMVVGSTRPAPLLILEKTAPLSTFGSIPSSEARWSCGKIQWCHRILTSRRSGVGWVEPNARPTAMRRVDQINPKGWRGIQRLFRGEEKGSSLALLCLAIEPCRNSPNEANCCPLLVITFQGVNVDAFGSANDKRNQFLSSQDGPERVGQTRTGQTHSALK